MTRLWSAVTCHRFGQGNSKAIRNGGRSPHSKLPYLFAALFLLISAATVLTQNPTGQTGVLRLRVRVKANDTAPLRGLSRKRFFLIRGSLEQNQGLLQAIEQQPLVTRDCYYTKLGASQALINWLKESDCESVYCREVENDFVAGAKAVPEFANAFAASQKEYSNADTARKWLTTNLPANVRDGFYRDRQTVLNSLLKQAETSSGAPVRSVMTDRNGTAYFTDLEPGTYVLSNLNPTELSQTTVTWNCEVTVKTGDLATEKPYMVSNKQDRNVKCVAVEKAMPACK